MNTKDYIIFNKYKYALAIKHPYLCDIALRCLVKKIINSRNDYFTQYWYMSQQSSNLC